MEKEPKTNKEIEIKENSFLLSWDVEALISLLCQAYGWQLPEKTVFEETKRNLETTLEDCFPGSVVSLPAEAINRKLFILANNTRLSAPLQPIVSADSVYARGTANFNLQPNRIIDSKGMLIGEGQRPGFLPLPKQIELIKEKLVGKNEITLLDSGAFEGKSLLRITNLFEKQGIRVTNVLLGIEVIGATDTLKKRKIECRSVLKIKKPIDWIESRDFIPFTPLCGRVIGDEYGPLLINGLSFAAPYLLPSGNPAEWASIPGEKIKDFSRQCWQISRTLFTCLEKTNPGLSISLEDIKRAPIRISYPGNPPRNLDMSTRILEIIQKNLNCLT